MISLPTGEPAIDSWFLGDRFEVAGTAIRFTPTVHSLDVPHLYALDYICTEYAQSTPSSGFPGSRMEFPNRGPLKVHPWWAPIQNWLWRFWARHSPEGSWWAVQIAPDQSPYYPLVNPDGTPAHGNFLLVLQRWGVASSRGSSPLDHLAAPKK